MANNQPTVDTPDGQVGVVSAQFLMGSFTGTTATATLGIPPNTETVIVQIGGGSASLAPTGVGVQSGTSYFPVPGGIQGTSGAATAWFFDVSPALDSQVTITFAIAPGSPWYVYSDAAAHIAADPNVAALIAGTNRATPPYGILVGGDYEGFFTKFIVGKTGNQYVTPTAPGTFTTDRPSTELLYASSGANNTTAVVLAAPGAGMRYRIFACNMAPMGLTILGQIYDSLNHNVLLNCDESSASLVFPLTGVALTANAGVILGATGGQIYCTVVYTLETV